MLHLPVIVESAESSPQAAAAAAYQMRKFLSKENYGRPQVQYNAIMLIRILADNPGPQFTKYLDAKFSNTMKQLLRESKDQSVQQIARETLSALYQEKGYDTNLSTIFQMWTKEQPGQIRPRTLNAPAFNAQQPPFQHPSNFGYSQGPPPMDNYARDRGGQSSGGLPSPPELAARVEEAKTSAKLLQQLVQSTSPAELQANDLVKEFAQRVSAAQKSVQGYINCERPPPDADTLQTLIETSEQLSLAASKHQRAVLQARRLIGDPTPPVEGSYEGTAMPASGPPRLNAPALPIRTGSNGLLQNPPRQTQTPPQQTTYIPPAGPPPGLSPQTATSPTSADSDTLYNPPAPTSSMQANLARRANPQTSPDPNAYKPLPPMVMNSEPIEMGTSHTPPPAVSAQMPSRKPPGSSKFSRPDDPFTDEHASPQDYSASSSRYGATPPPAAQFQSTPTPRSLRSTPQRGSTGGYATTAAEPDARTGSQTSYHPGYTSTLSYVHRQQSSGDRFVMHGGRMSPDAQGQPQQQGAMGRIGNAVSDYQEDYREEAPRPRTTSREGSQGGYGRGTGSVSPLYERDGGAGYRY